MTNKTLQKIIIVLLVIMFVLVLFTGYSIYKKAPPEAASEDQTVPVSSEKFGGASPEELQAMLEAIAPADGEGGLNEDEMLAALENLRKEETNTEAEITPEGDVKVLTEAEIQERLQELEVEGVSDNDVEITPE